MPEERKLVTVLFADVTGSTALGEDLDPEDVRALMGRYYEHARRVVADHGGTLEKFIGDAVMAVFGLPHAHGDDAERAVAAALALRQAVAEDVALPGVVLRMGVNTGEVVATTDPSGGDFLVTGDAVNVAARLQQCASPGEVLASERTYAATGAAFVFGDRREIEVKGKRELLPVFPVAGARTVRQVERPPMVGREDDLMMLSLLHRRAIREGRPQLVSIVAPAGTGKTRLLEEFLADLDSDASRRATCRCLPYGQSLTYWPLRGLMEELLGDVDRERVVAAFEGAGQDADDARRLADLVLSTFGIEGEASADRESIFSAWRLLVEALAEHGPLTVVFEDLHWASDSLLDLVEQILHPRTRAPLLLIAVSRPELLDRRPTWGSGARQNVTTLALEPLSEDQTAELVSRLGEGLPQAIRRRIVERSGGNPFFITELVRGLAERGIHAGTPATETVPDTVHAAVLARLDLLDPTERRVLQAAAVGGRLFRPAIVQAVLDDLGTRDLEAAIDDLLARDLIIPDEGGAFTFRHILIRDIAYGTLSRADRIRMHSGVAAWLETYAAGRLDEFVELIAYHYGQAVTLARRSPAPPPLPLDPAKAVFFLERAGELAGRAGAPIEGRNHLQTAIAIAPPQEHIRLYEKLGDVGVHGEAYQEALQRWREGGMDDPRTGARLLRKLSVSCNRWWSRPAVPLTDDEIAGLLPEAQQLAERAGDRDEIWRVRVANVFEYWWHHRDSDGDTTDADAQRAIALEAAAYFEERGDWEASSEALDASTSIAITLSEWDNVIETATRRLSLPQLSVPERGDAQHMILWATCARGEYDRCMALVQEILAKHRVGEPVAYLAAAWVWFTISSTLTGHWSELDDLRPRIADALDELGGSHPSFQGVYFDLLLIALAREDRAEVDAAATVLRRLLAGQRLAGVRSAVDAFLEDDPSLLDLDGIVAADNPWWTHLLLVFTNEHGVRLPDPFLDFVRRLRSSHGEWDAIPPTVDIAEALASGDADALAQAIDTAEHHHLIPHAARVRIVLAQRTGDPTPLEQARPVLERLQDRQFLRRLDEVAASLR